jgi:hypothetical protein
MNLETIYTNILLPYIIFTDDIKTKNNLKLVSKKMYEIMNINEIIDYKSFHNYRTKILEKDLSQIDYDVNKLLDILKNIKYIKKEQYNYVLLQTFLNYVSKLIDDYVILVDEFNEKNFYISDSICNIIKHASKDKKFKGIINYYSQGEFKLKDNIKYVIYFADNHIIYNNIFYKADYLKRKIDHDHKFIIISDFEINNDIYEKVIYKPNDAYDTWMEPDNSYYTSLIDNMHFESYYKGFYNVTTLLNLSTDQYKNLKTMCNYTFGGKFCNVYIMSELYWSDAGFALFDKVYAHGLDFTCGNRSYGSLLKYKSTQPYQYLKIKTKNIDEILFDKKDSNNENNYIRKKENTTFLENLLYEGCKVNGDFDFSDMWD